MPMGRRYMQCSCKKWASGDSAVGSLTRPTVPMERTDMQCSCKGWASGDSAVGSLTRPT
eukprot:CAMPEP_0118924876 /NCGR_PEP_ID=MMETSP1169-20130426/2811_1 /TAXON_ID=36882 /ORGANISM="Pyramimonas obovata, Strain CCMP722" /LENGTH=58 /DNA_ID=CAMNT_0006866015 /DNA_START=46 /DNA_END=219 /DNA_ORIENTATION=+